jgi:hypothetical protein
VLGHPNLVPSNNRVCCPYVCSDSPLRALEYFRDQHSQIQPRSPPLTAILKTMQERFTVPPARAIWVASVVRWKQHRTNGALSPRTRGVVTTKQTSQVTTAPAHTLNRSYWQCLEIGFLPGHPIESVSEPVVVCIISS